MAIPLLPPMTQLMTPELLLSSPTPEKRPLADFCTWVLHTPDFSDAPIQQVSCNRSGVHEFVIISCKVTLSANRSVHLVWLRLERHPSEGGVSLMSKSNNAKDTVQVSKSVDALLVAKRGQKCVPRGTFSYYSEDHPSTTLKLQHIAEMLLCFTQYSSLYSLLKTNCRWLCYALLECLKECHTCYGGNWIGLPLQRTDSTTDTKTALEVKDLYLREKHPRCCMSRQTSTINALLVGTVASVAPSLMNPELQGNPHASSDSQPAVVGVPAVDVIYSTPRAPAPSTQPVQHPASTSNNAYNHPTPYSPHVHPSALPPNAHQSYNGNGAPRWENIPIPTPSASGFQPSGQIHAQNYVNAHPRAQASPLSWRGSVCSSTHCCSPAPVAANIPRSRHPHQMTQGSYDLGGLYDHQGHPYFAHTRNNTSNSCNTCSSNNHHQGNIASRSGFYHPHTVRGHTRTSSAGSQYSSGDFCTHQTHMNHGHCHPPADLCSIPEGSYMERQDNWDANHQPSPRISEHGPCFGCASHQAMHPGQSAVPSQDPSNSVRPQMPSYGSGYPQHYNNHPYPAAMGGVPPHQPSRPEPGRGWTQEVWTSHGGEVPMRTESPGPLEEDHMGQGSLDEYPIPLVKMPDARDYMSLT